MFLSRIFSSRQPNIKRIKNLQKLLSLYIEREREREREREEPDEMRRESAEMKLGFRRSELICVIRYLFIYIILTSEGKGKE